MSLKIVNCIKRIKTSKMLIHIDNERGIWNIFDENKEDLHITTTKNISKYRLMYDKDEPEVDQIAPPTIDITPAAETVNATKKLTA